MINKNPPSCRCTQNNMLSPQLLRVHIQPTMRPYCANSQYRGRYKFHQMRANFSYFVTTSKQKLFYMFLNSCPFSGMCLGISSCVFFLFISFFAFSEQHHISQVSMFFPSHVFSPCCRILLCYGPGTSSDSFLHFHKFFSVFQCTHTSIGSA